MLGLSGEAPDTVDPAAIETTPGTIRDTQTLLLAGKYPITFHESTDLLFHRDQMYPPHAVCRDLAPERHALHRL